MKVHNIISQCDDGNRRERQTGDIKHIAVHRIWFNDWDLHEEHSPIEICRRFVDDPEVAKYTGGENAYTLLVDREGLVYQAIPLHEVGYHARRWNMQAIGIGVVGDFRRHPPTWPQRSSLVELCSRLSEALGFDYQKVWGHTEFPEGSSDPDKECPGEYIDMEDLRRDIRDYTMRSAIAELSRDGLSIV